MEKPTSLEIDDDALDLPGPEDDGEGAIDVTGFAPEPLDSARLVPTEVVDLAVDRADFGPKKPKRKEKRRVSKPDDRKWGVLRSGKPKSPFTEVMTLRVDPEDASYFRKVCQDHAWGNGTTFANCLILLKRELGDDE